MKVGNVVKMYWAGGSVPYYVTITGIGLDGIRGTYKLGTGFNQWPEFTFVWGNIDSVAFENDGKLEDLFYMNGVKTKINGTTTSVGDFIFDNTAIKDLAERIKKYESTKASKEIPF